MPVFEAKKEEEEKASSDSKGPRTITKTVIMPDGSYGTETIVLDDSSAVNDKEEDQFPLRKCLKTSEDDFLASCVAISLTKLVVKCKKNL